MYSAVFHIKEYTYLLHKGFHCSITPNVFRLSFICTSILLDARTINNWKKVGRYEYDGLFKSILWVFNTMIQTLLRRSKTLKRHLKQ